MTTYTDLLIDTANRAYERFVRAFDGVSVEQANAFPAASSAPQIKSMTWLAWHTARELDFQIAALNGATPLWHSQAWKNRFPFTVTDDEQDWRHTLKQAQRIQTDSTETVLGYLKAATDAAAAYIAKLREADLDDIVDENWTPPVTRGVRLVSIIDDAVMHSGQVFYARRLLGLTD